MKKFSWLIMSLLGYLTVKSQDFANTEASNYSSPQLYNSFSAKSMSYKRIVDMPKKRFSFTASFDPNFTHTTPPIYTFFEFGIANLASAGLSLGVSYDKSDIPSTNIQTGFLTVGPRIVGYPLAIISKIMGEEINAAGFEPHVGLVYDYIVMKRKIDDEDDGTFTDSQFGVSFGTRYYPANNSRFAIFAEYNTNGIGYSIFKVPYSDLSKNSGGFRLGVTLGR